MVTTAITVDVKNPNIPVITYASQGDQLSRQLQITLVDGSTAWTPPTGAVAAVRYSKPDGTSGFYDTVEDGTPAVTISGNVATVKLIQQMTTVAGTVYAQLNWYTAGTNPQRVSSFCWRVMVEAAAVQDGTIVSSDYYSILTAQIQTCIAAASSCEAIRNLTVAAATLPAGSSATATTSGGSSAQNPLHIDFGIPTGPAGPAPTVASTTITYAGQTSAAFNGTPPVSGWQSTVPTVTSGNYLWTKTVVTFAGNAGTTTTFGCTKYGTDGTGAVLSVNGQTGAVVLDGGDISVDASAASPTSVAQALSTIDSSVTSLNGTVVAHTSQISALSTSVTTNTNNITSLSASVGTNTSNIASLQSTTGTHTTQISSLSSSVGTNTSNIASLQSNKQDKIISTSATLSSSGWSSLSQTVSVSGVTTSNSVIVSPAPASYTTYSNSSVYCSGQGNGTLTFTCSTVPAANVNVNILIIG